MDNIHIPVDDFSKYLCIYLPSIFRKHCWTLTVGTKRFFTIKHDRIEIEIGISQSIFHYIKIVPFV